MNISLAYVKYLLLLGQINRIRLAQAIVGHKYGEITTKTCVAPTFSMWISPLLSAYYGR